MPGAPIPDCDGSNGAFACQKCEVLCDNGTVPTTPFLRFYIEDCSTGNVVSTVDTELDGVTPYVVIGDPVVCAGDVTLPPQNIPDTEVVCFDAPPSPLMRMVLLDPVTGAIVVGPIFRDILTGAVVVPAGVPVPCPEFSAFDVEQEVLCDDDTDPATPFIRRYTFVDGILTSVDDFELDGTTPYVVAGTAVNCDAQGNIGSCKVFCDEGNANVEFVRCYTLSPGGAVDVDDFDLDGAPYVVIGPIGDCCDDSECIDGEGYILCDDGTSPSTPFIRRFDVASGGGVTVVDTDLDGVGYVVLGAAIVCPPSASGLLLTNGTVNIFGPGSWALGVDDGGGSVKSVTFAALRVGSVGPPPAAGSVTVTDGFGNTETLFPGQTKTWEVDSGEDALTGTLRVDTTAALDIVTVLWTEV